MSYLSSKKCPICNKRGDRIKKKCMKILKAEEDLNIYFFHFNLQRNSLNLNDIVCWKHKNKLKRDNAAYYNNNKCDRVENNNNDVDANKNVSDDLSVSSF